MSSLQRQLNRLFDDALTPANWDGFDNKTRIPAAELTQTDDAVHLKLRNAVIRKHLISNQVNG